MPDKHCTNFREATMMFVCLFHYCLAFDSTVLMSRSMSRLSNVCSLRRTAARSTTWTMNMDEDQNKPSEKWATPIENESLERIESVKAGFLSAISGSIAMTPFALVADKSFYPSTAFSAQWELSHDGLAIMLALFGIVYRYAVRQDPNPQLKQVSASEKHLYFLVLSMTQNCNTI